jgi:hypothetical protein
MLKRFLEVETTRSGQPRPYADSEYEYAITSDFPGFIVENFCTKVLQPKTQAKQDWDKGGAGSYFAGYYTFKDLGDGKFRYYVFEPFCD